MHLVQLAQLDVALSRTEDVETLRRLVAEWIEQAGMVRFQDASQPEAFEVVDGTGDRLEILVPAYIDAISSRVIKQGQARAVDSNAVRQSEAVAETRDAHPDEARQSPQRAAPSATPGQEGVDESSDAEAPVEEEVT